MALLSEASRSFFLAGPIATKETESENLLLLKATNKSFLLIDLL